MKKILVLILILAFLLSLAGCANILGPLGLLGDDDDSKSQTKSSTSQKSTKQSNPATKGSTTDQSQQDGYWEQYDMQIIVPDSQIISDENDTIEYDFSSGQTSVSLNMKRTGTGGIETIDTSGSWTMPEEDYFAGQPIRIDLTASINKFERKWTNFSGVIVYAYLGSESTPLGSATAQALRDANGEGTCAATINNGEIVVGKGVKTVSISAPKGTAKQKMVILVVVSNQGKQGGAKIFYEWKEW